MCGQLFCRHKGYNIKHLLTNPYFEVIRHDICQPLYIEVDEIYNLRNTPIWIEISENDLGIPAAAMPVHDTELKVWRFPKAIWDTLEPSTYHFRTVDNVGNEIHHSTFAHYQAI